MSASINFLSERRKKLTKQQVLDQKIFKLLTGVGIGVFIIFLFTLGVRLAFAFNLDQITKKENQTLQIVQSQESSEKSYVIFAAKLKVISELFVQRRDKQEAIKYFSTLFGPEVTVSDIAYEADTSLLTFGLKANNIFTLDQVFNKLGTPEVRAQFKSVAATELRRDKQGAYQTSVVVTLKDEPVNPQADVTAPAASTLPEAGTTDVQPPVTP